MRWEIVYVLVFLASVYVVKFFFLVCFIRCCWLVYLICHDWVYWVCGYPRRLEVEDGKHMEVFHHWSVAVKELHYLSHFVS